jgi:hypothetical protein
MADFTIEAVSGLTLVTYVDPPVTIGGLKPTRLNPQPGLPHKFWRSGAPSSQIDIRCYAEGTLGPPDFLLGGRPFTWAWVDRPYEPLPAIPTITGASSRVRFPVGALGEGHFTIQALRPSGGSVGFSFDVVEIL